MIQTRANINIYGQQVEAQKISIFAELDQAGDIFIKTECQNGPVVTLVSFSYDYEAAMKGFESLMRQFLAEQIENLRKVAEANGD